MPDGSNQLFTLDRLDPQVVALHEAMRAQGLVSADPLAMPLHQARAAAERAHLFLNRDAPPIPARNIETEGPAGPLRLRLYRPPAIDERPLPVLVYFHGGGFAVNSVDTHDRLLRLLALRSGAAVVAVAYGKAPEHRFPHQHDEALAALRWVAREGAAHGLDGGRLAVGGDSAGANLALGAALAARAPGEPRVSFGLLFYGMFAHDFHTPSHRRFGDGRYGLTTARMRWYWEQYLGHAEPTRDPRAAPLLADLSGLPPLLLLAAGLDCLRDDSLRLAERLAAADVPFDLTVHESLPHSFANMTRLVEAADGAVTRAALAVRAHLAA
ncbi:acetyl esterase [Azospirillum agricola]|uniref:alpha/beta hydrolase fold domain-containing protein n=1 Tax=Azospirillum agricola TaxID=1720247 RepID=UPI001AEA5C3A|nr:alpha/beta hydrolase [Azospirillum agricola]MBP2227800.1 acetyl esterase [Azospirillum agricola]